MSRWYLVSQNKSYQFEFDNRILWSPKKNRDGSSSYSYDCMKNVQTGDIIINVYHQHIMGISVALTDAYSKDKPIEFKDAIWSVSGWQVDLKIKKLKIPLAPEREFFANPDNKKLKNDAFNKNGTINQGYLFELGPLEVNHIKNMILTNLLDINIE